jgi:hypothetical protein
MMMMQQRGDGTAREKEHALCRKEMAAQCEESRDAREREHALCVRKWPCSARIAMLSIK